MATTRKGTPADDPESYSARGGEAGAAATDCAACGAPLPPGNRYLCEACVAESERRAQAIWDGLQAPQAVGPAPEVGDAAAVEEEDLMACPTCGMRLDPSGRCAGCVTTVRR